MTTTLLFVYGTLRRDPAGRRHPLLGPDAVYLGPARWQGRLYRLADYPGAVPSADRSDLVHGELYALPDPDTTLTRLDAYEDCDAADPEYRRERVVVITPDGGGVEAWTYCYARSVDGLRRIESGDFGPGLILEARRPPAGDADARECGSDPDEP